MTFAHKFPTVHPSSPIFANTIPILLGPFQKKGKCLKLEYPIKVPLFFSSSSLPKNEYVEVYPPVNIQKHVEKSTMCHV